ncbi:hypothetical protein HNQ36_001075 [Afipia massiliensis]|uniref:Uncharacterized protein n=1 Tax=Afipia massiliensis TaxID=211460 RepID=A0A840MZT4_9BRAD|nr:hypothetical protein [Afipia massiliensis]MBB5051121.1 hypothetical protein [Afipia massiliensis]
MRKPAAANKPRIAKPASFPAPVGGWIKNQNLATPGARRPDGSKVNGAFVLENYFPTATGIRIRKGSSVFSTIAAGVGTVDSLFAYVNGGNEKLFAANETDIWDISTPGSPASVVSGLTSGEWSVAQSSTPGGIFLRAVNGADDPQLFDGTSWGTGTPISAAGLDPKTLATVWIYKQRAFFTQKDSLNAWYLPVDSLGGTAVLLPLGGVFTKGGSLLFGATWSIESGNGPNEYCVFVSTKGEAAVFTGADPSSAATWTKVGVYRIGRPLGPKAHIPAGGDLVIATDIGFVPLSQAMQRDYSALSPAAISYSIEVAWNETVAARAGTGWACEVWPTEQMVVVAIPTGVNDQPQMFVANARTGAWGLYTGWNGRCLQLFKDRLFFGSTDGKIIEAEVTGADQELPYTATCVPLFDPLKAPASLKTSLLMRATIRASAEVIPKLSLQADYKLNLPTAPDDGTVATGNVWGVGVWGVATWSAPAQKNIYQRWQPVGGSGYAIAPAMQITSGSLVPPDAELVVIDMTYDQGDIAS